MHLRRHKGVIVRAKRSKQSGEIGGERRAILMICLYWKVVAVHWLFRHANILYLYPPVQVYYVEEMTCEVLRTHLLTSLKRQKIVKDALRRSFIRCGHFKTMCFSVVWNVTCKCYATADKRGSWYLLWYRKRCVSRRHAMRSNFEIYYFAWQNTR